MGKLVKFDPTSPVAMLPDLYLPGNAPAVHGIAAHISRRAARKLKAGKWFVQMAHDGRGGHIGLHDDDRVIEFSVKEA